MSAGESSDGTRVRAVSDLGITSQEETKEETDNTKSDELSTSTFVEEEEEKEPAEDGTKNGEPPVKHEEGTGDGADVTVSRPR